MHRFLLATLLAVLGGCYGGMYLPPSLAVPGLQRAGQASLAASIRPTTPAGSASGSATVALTDHVRLALGGVGAFTAHRRGGYGDVLLGGEFRVARFIEVGGLGGVGYGAVRARHAYVDPVDNAYSPVQDGYVDEVRGHYLRYALQGHVLLRAPKIVQGGGGLRLSLIDAAIDAVDDAPVSAHGRPVAIEPFGFVRVGQPWLQFEMQLRYTGVVHQPSYAGRDLFVPDRMTISLGLRVVLGPGIGWVWPRRAGRPR
jgi:hypothetical protein